MAISGSQRVVHPRRRKKRHLMSEINVTPFVDVVLVLLVIFVVAAPLLTAGIPVRLPDTAAEPMPVSNDQPIVVSVAADGRLAVGEQMVAESRFIDALRTASAGQTEPRIHVRGDRDAKYETVVQVIGAMNKAGFRNIGLVTGGSGPDFDDGDE